MVDSHGVARSRCCFAGGCETGDKLLQGAVARCNDEQAPRLEEAVHTADVQRLLALAIL